MSDAPLTSPLTGISDALAELVARAAPVIVAVHSQGARSSGFLWRPGLVVTASEALSEEGEITVVLPGGESARASVAGRDPTTDVVLLRIDRKHDDLPASPAGAGVRAGMLAVVVGSEDGDPTASLGIVSLARGGWRSLRGGEINARIELDVTMRRSAEGGLALDCAGGVIGMAVFGPRRRVLVIPSATIDRVAQVLDSHGRIARGYLGLGLQVVGVDENGTGVMVMGVDARGPGAAAGICQGDVVVAWDGAPISRFRGLLRRLGPDSVGCTVRLLLKRAGKPVEVSLTIGERPEA
jgi:S1-C subfamily serine protease